MGGKLGRGDKGFLSDFLGMVSIEADAIDFNTIYFSHITGLSAGRRAAGAGD